MPRYQCNTLPVLAIASSDWAKDPEGFLVPETVAGAVARALCRCNMPILGPGQEASVPLHRFVTRDCRNQPLEVFSGAYVTEFADTPEPVIRALREDGLSPADARTFTQRMVEAEYWHERYEGLRPPGSAFCALRVFRRAGPDDRAIRTIGPRRAGLLVRDILAELGTTWDHFE